MSYVDGLGECFALILYICSSAVFTGTNVAIFRQENISVGSGNKWFKLLSTFVTTKWRKHEKQLTQLKNQSKGKQKYPDKNGERTCLDPSLKKDTYTVDKYAQTITVKPKAQATSTWKTSLIT